MSISCVEIEGGSIAYDVVGEGPLVLCVPGMGDLRSAYRFTVPALVEAGFRVATMDLRGHGGSSDGFESYNDEALARDIVAVIADLGSPAIVVANSMGAASAVIASVESPASVVALALFGPMVHNPPSSAVMTVLMRAVLHKPWGPAAWRMYYTSLFPGRRPADHDEQLARVRKSLATGRHWRSFVATTRTDHTPSEVRLDRVSHPVLVVMGEKDPDWKDPIGEAESLRDRLGAEVLLVPGSGHYPMAEYPEQVNPVLIRFVERVTQHA